MIFHPQELKEKEPVLRKSPAAGYYNLWKKTFVNCPGKVFG